MTRKQKVLLSYFDMLELTDILDELQDKDTIKAVQDGRMAIANGTKGIPVENLFVILRLDGTVETVSEHRFNELEVKH